MAEKNEDITTSLRMDITDLKANIQEANRYIKLANSEFKEASAGMDDWASSADGLSAKIKQQHEVFIQQNRILSSLKDQYAQVVEEQGENSKAAVELQTKINNQLSAITQTQKEMDKYAAKLVDVTLESKRSKTAMESLTDTINDQESKLAELKNKYKEVVLSQGATSDEAQALAREISDLNAELQENKSKMNEVDRAADGLTESLDDVGKEAKDTSDGFTVAKGALSDLVSNGIQFAISKANEFVSSLFSMADATKEYRQMTAKIEGSANSFGYSIEFAKDQYKEFYSYLNDDQMATNAITNLMGMKVSTETVTKTAEAAIGVWSAYGDSIPIESLTESINETAQVGKVTGVLADALNWAGLSEDDFNAKLEKTNSTQERADMIANTLNSTYGKSKKTYDELSGSMIEASKAEIELKEAQAELGKSLEPLNTEFTKLKTKALKSLSPMVSDVKDEFVELIEDIDWDSAADTIGDLLESTADGLKFVINNIEPISALVKGLGTAWLTYKTAQLAANSATTVGNNLQILSEAALAKTTAGTIAHTTATKASTVATKALALAQKLTPWGMVAGLIGGVVLGLGAYVSSQKEAKEETDENVIATNKLAKEYERLNDDLKENKKARTEAIESVEAEVGSADILFKKLEELASVEEKSNSQKSQMKHYVDELNGILPDLNLQYDAEKDALNLSTDAIRRNIDAQKDLMIAKAAQESLGDIARDIAETELKLAEASEQHTTNEKELKKAKEETIEAQKKWIDAGMQYYGEEYKAYEDAFLAQEKSQKAYDKSKKTVEGLKKEVKNLNGEYDKTDQYAQKMLDSAEIEKKLAEITEIAKQKGVEIPKSVANGIKEGNYLVPASVEEMKSLITYDSLVQQAQAEGLKIPKSLSESIASGKTSPAQAVEQMNSLISFSDLLKKSQIAGEQVPKSVSEAVLNGKLTPAQAVQQMKNLVTFEDLLSRSKAAGQKIPKDIQEAVLSGKMSPVEAVREMENLMVEEADKAAPKMKESGKKSSSEFAEGVGANKEKAKTKGSEVASSAKTGYESVGAYESGQNMTQGFINGIGSLVDSVWKTASSVAQSALDAIKKVGKEGSPWKTTIESGEWLGEGFVIGMTNSLGAIKKSATSIANTALNAVKDIDMNRALQVSNMKSALSSNISDIRTPRQTTSNSKQTQKGRDVVFNQTIISPKPQSRKEIYQQTNNLLFSAKARLKNV